MSLLKVKKTITTPYHPQNKVLVEVVKKTIAKYLKKFEYKHTELGIIPSPNPICKQYYLSPKINSTPFKVTYGVNQRTPEFDLKKLFRENYLTDLYQRIKVGHERAKNLTQTNDEKADDQ